jgi:hypothetical protein
MISDLTIHNGGPGVGAKSDLVLSALESQPIQPVRDVQAYLDDRKAVADCAQEKHLLITLPKKIQDEVKALVRACQFVADLVKAKWSVQAACKSALSVFDKWHWKLATFRPKYDLWAKAGDWVVLVNRAKAPAAWKAGSVGLPEAFLDHCEKKFARFARRDGKRQAWLAIKRHWEIGRDEDGRECPVPGYEAIWRKREPQMHPVGWGYDNICDQIRKRSRFNKVTRALLHEGVSAAREFLPHALGTRQNLRFLERVTFDDVRMDWLVFDPATGQAVELWLLVARDEATAMVLGFVMHPATVREDGKATHLGAQQMKELAAYLLERYPLPPYLVHWIVERGTATLAEAVKAALAELFNARIKVHYTSMIGGKSPVGYAEKRKGNSRGKASHEAHNRLFHTQASFLPGQTGASWSIRPADLEARVKECQAIHAQAQQLPEDQRGQVEYPLLTLDQAREKFAQLCHQQNFRDDHQIEGFEKVIEVWTGERWELAAAAAPGAQCRTRMERPVERALRLIRSVERWDKVSPDIIVTFLEHTQRLVTVTDKGEVELQIEGRKVYFRHAGEPLDAGTKALAYLHPGEPQFLHLTTGDGRILGTWCQRGRGSFLDNQALAEAMRYTSAARAAAQATAAELAAPQREQLAAMRERNAERFNTITTAPAATGELAGGTIGSAMRSIHNAGETMKVNPPEIKPIADCTEEVLGRKESAPDVKFD